MKKKLFVGVVFSALTIMLTIACSKEDKDAITVGYSSEEGTGGNPDNTSAGTGTTSGATTSTSLGSTSTTGSTTTTT